MVEAIMGDGDDEKKNHKVILIQMKYLRSSKKDIVLCACVCPLNLKRNIKKKS